MLSSRHEAGAWRQAIWRVGVVELIGDADQLTSKVCPGGTDLQTIVQCFLVGTRLVRGGRLSGALVSLS